MPTPDQLGRSRDWTSPFPHDAIPTRGMHPENSAVERLADQVESLAAEVRELKKMLEPIPSFILTGQQVLAEFERLQKKEKYEQR